MAGTVVVLLLAVWLAALAVFVSEDTAEEFLWIPVLLAAAGVVSSILPFAIPSTAAVAMNGTILILFVVSLEVLQRRRFACMRNHAR